MDPMWMRYDSPHPRADAFLQNAIVGRAAQGVPNLVRYPFEAMLDVAGVA
jgi:hypothetical protein